MAGGFVGPLAASTTFHVLPTGLAPRAAAVFAAHENLRDNKTRRSASDTEGGNRRTEKNNRNFRRQAEVGVHYLLPLPVRAELRTDLTGQLRAQLERRDQPLSNNVFMDIRANTDREFTLGFRYNGQ